MVPKELKVPKVPTVPLALWVLKVLMGSLWCPWGSGAHGVLMHKVLELPMVLDASHGAPGASTAQAAHGSYSS